MLDHSYLATWFNFDHRDYRKVLQPVVDPGFTERGGGHKWRACVQNFRPRPQKVLNHAPGCS